MSIDGNINAIEIRERVKYLHSEFMDKYASEIDKLIADHKLLSERVITKIKYILNIFKEQGVIDEIVDLSRDCPYKKVRLSKRGNSNYIDIITNGESIAISGFNYEANSGELNPFKVRFSDVNKEDFNWSTFSLVILDQIHMVIYERKRASEIKVNGVFNEIPGSKEQDVVIIKTSKKATKKDN